MSTKLLELIKKNDHKDIETFLESNKLWFENNDIYDSVLEYCVKNNLINIIRLFIDHELILKDLRKGTMSILLCATSVDMIIFLIDNDITVDVLNKNIRIHAPIINLMLFRELDVFLFLVKMGLDLNVEGISIKHKKELDFLIRYKPDAETIKTWFFTLSVNVSEFNFIEYLIIKYPETCSQLCNKDNILTFYYTIRPTSISIDAIELLIDNGLDIDIQCDFGHTGFFYIVTSGREDLVNLFYEKGVNINHVNNEGKNALFYAHDNRIINLLLDLGIDMYQKNNNGYYPINYIYNDINLSTKIRFFDACCEDKKQQIVDDTIRLQSLDTLNTLSKKHDINKYIDKSEYKNLLYKNEPP